MGQCSSVSAAVSKKSGEQTELDPQAGKEAELERQAGEQVELERQASEQAELERRRQMKKEAVTVRVAEERARMKQSSPALLAALDAALDTSDPAIISLAFSKARPFLTEAKHAEVRGVLQRLKEASSPNENHTHLYRHTPHRDTHTHTRARTRTSTR